MSEFHVVVFEVGKVGKHPNADSLEISQVMDAYPVIFRTGQFKQGDKAVFVPVDALVPLDDPRWEFLKTDDAKTHTRIKAKKLRGIFSMGVLTEADPSWEIGQNVQEQLRIEKWEPYVAANTGGENERDPGLPVYTDLEGLRKYKKYLVEGEDVILQEKVHGANFRAVHMIGKGLSEGDDRLFVGSHNGVKRENSSNIFWKAALQYNLATKLAAHPNKVFYGEVYGQVQKGFDYGVKPGEIAICFFDIFDPTIGRYVDFEDMEKILAELDLPLAPILYKGPWNENLMETLSNGKTSYPANHTREGFVVRPAKERWGHVGRIIFKMPGSDYLLTRAKQK